MSKSDLANSFVTGASINDAWKIFKKDWISVYMVIGSQVVFSIAFNALNQIFADTALAPLLGLVYMVLSLIVGMAVIKGVINITRGKKVDLNILTEVAPQALKYIAVTILYFLIVFAGFIFFIIPGIYLSLKYSFAMFLVVDKGLGPIEALKESAKISDGIKWDMIGAYTVFGLVSFIGVIALGVGLLISAPVAYLAQVVFYNKVVEAKS